MFLKGKPANSANVPLRRKDKCMWTYSHDEVGGISKKKKHEIQASIGT